MPFNTEKNTEVLKLTAKGAAENTFLSAATASQATKPLSVYAPPTAGRDMTTHAEILHMTRALEGADEPFHPLCLDFNEAPPSPARDPTSQCLFSLAEAGKIFGKVAARCAGGRTRATFARSKMTGSSPAQSCAP